MASVRNIRIQVLTATALAALLSGCSSDNKPKPPQPGTPAFNWLSARQAYEKGDYAKANDLLAQLARGNSEFAERSRPLALLTAASLANACMELNEKFAEGAKKTRGSMAPYMRNSSVYKSRAAAAGIQFVEEARLFSESNKDKDVVLGLPMPKASMDDPPQYTKLTTGLTVPEAELPGIEQAAIERQLAKMMGSALGEAKDPEKARAKFANGEAKAAGPAFLLTIAKGLFDVAEMNGPKKLSQPNRITAAMYDEALKQLAMVKDNKEARELEKKITAARKKLIVS